MSNEREIEREGIAPTSTRSPRRTSSVTSLSTPTTTPPTPTSTPTPTPIPTPTRATSPPPKRSAADDVDDDDDDDDIPDDLDEDDATDRRKRSSSVDEGDRSAPVRSPDHRPLFGERVGAYAPRDPIAENDREITSRSDLAKAVEKYRLTDDAWIHLYRLLPDSYNGQSCDGYVGKVATNIFQNSAEFEDWIARHHGGQLWRVQFMVPNGQGNKRVFGPNCRVNIQGPPKFSQTPEGAPTSGPHHPVVIRPPETEMVETLMKGQQALTNDLRSQLKEVSASGGGQLDKLIMLMRDVNKENAASQKQVFETVITAQKEQLEDLKRQVETMVQPGNSASNLEMLKIASGANTAASSAAIERYDRQISDLTQRLADAERRSADERRHTTELHTRELADGRRDRENAEQRLTAALDAERRSKDDLKTSMELNARTQVESTAGILKAQIQGLENQIAMLNAKITDLERQRDQIMQDRMRDLSQPRPDALGSLDGTLGSVKKIADALGYSRSSEPVHESVALLEAAGKSGVLDGLGRIAGRFADALKPQQPYMMPVMAQGMPGMPFPVPPSIGMGPSNQMYAMPGTQQQQPAPAAPQRFASPPPQQTQPSPPQPSVSHQPSQPQAAPLPREAQMVIVKSLEEAMSSGVPTRDLADQLVKVYGPEVNGLIGDGVEPFIAMVESVAPESALLSARGDGWLRDLFTTIKQIIGGR